MDRLILERAEQTIARALAERFEGRPYNRAVVTSCGRSDEPRVTVAGRMPASVPDSMSDGGPLTTCGVTVSLSAATEHENRAIQIMLELVSLLHDGDFPGGDLVIVDCAFTCAWLERHPTAEESRCHADFSLALLAD